MSQAFSQHPQSDPSSGYGSSDAHRPSERSDELDALGVGDQDLCFAAEAVGPSRQRPFDAQYWACWLAVVAVLSLIAHLLWTT